MIILFVTPLHAKFHYGGLAFSAERIARNLVTRGADVHVVLFDSGHQYHGRSQVPQEYVDLSVDGTTIHYVPPSFSYTHAALKNENLARHLQQAYFLLRDLTHELDPTCLVSFFAMPYGYPCSIVAIEMNVPLIVAVRGNDVGRFIHDPMRLPLLQHVFLHADAVTTLASDLARFVRYIQPQVRHVTVIHNGIEPDKVLRSTRCGTRRTDAEFVIGSLGVFKPKKGIELLLRAFTLAATDKWRLLLAGDFYKSNSQLSQFLGGNLATRCELTGIVPREEALERLSEMDVFVAPTLSDGCPNALLEAMVAGKPIIASAIGASADLLTHQESAFLLPVPRVADIVEALRAFEASTSLRHRIGTNAALAAKKLYPPYEEHSWWTLVQQAIQHPRSRGQGQIEVDLQ